MLLMIWTNTTIVRAAIFGFCMWFYWVLRLLVEIPDLLIVFHIICDQHFLKAVVFATFSEVNIVILEDDFCINFTMAVIA